MTKDFLFRDEESGEEFFVEIDGTDIKKMFVKASIVAIENFRQPRFISVVEPDEAEELGFDTY